MDALPPHARGCRHGTVRTAGPRRVTGGVDAGAAGVAAQDVPQACRCAVAHGPGWGQHVLAQLRAQVREGPAPLQQGLPGRLCLRLMVCRSLRCRLLSLWVTLRHALQSVCRGRTGRQPDMPCTWPACILLLTPRCLAGATDQVLPGLPVSPRTCRSGSVLARLAGASSSLRLPLGLALAQLRLQLLARLEACSSILRLCCLRAALPGGPRDTSGPCARPALCTAGCHAASGHREPDGAAFTASPPGGPNPTCQVLHERLRLDRGRLGWARPCMRTAVQVCIVHELVRVQHLAQCAVQPEPAGARAVPALFRCRGMRACRAARSGAAACSVRPCRTSS